MKLNNGAIVTSDKFKLCVTGQDVIDRIEQIAADNLSTRAVRRGRGAHPVEIVADEEPPALTHTQEKDEQVEVQTHLVLLSVNRKLFSVTTTSEWVLDCN